jgi:hypothetical protein
VSRRILLSFREAVAAYRSGGQRMFSSAD